MELFRRLKIPESKVLAKLSLSSKENVEISTSIEPPPVSPPVPETEKPRLDNADIGVQQKEKQRVRGKQPIAPRPVHPPPLKQGAATNNVERSGATEPKAQGGPKLEAARRNPVATTESYLPAQIQTRSGKTTQRPKLNSIEQRARRKADPPGNVKRHPSVTANSTQDTRPPKLTSDKTKRHSPSSIEKRRMRRSNSLSPSGSSGKGKVGSCPAPVASGETNATKLPTNATSPTSSRSRPKVPILRSLELALVGGSEAKQLPQRPPSPEVVSPPLSTVHSAVKERNEPTPWVLQSPSGADMKRPVGSLLGDTDLIGELDEMDCVTPRIRNRFIDVELTNLQDCSANQPKDSILDASLTGESLNLAVEDSGVSNHHLSNSMSNNLSTGDLSLDPSMQGGSQRGGTPNERRHSATGGTPNSPGRSSRDAAIRRRRARSTSRSRGGGEMRGVDQTDARSATGSEHSSTSPRSSRPRRRSRSRSRSRSRTRSQPLKSPGPNDASSGDAPPSPTRRPARSPKAGPPVTKRTPAQKLSMKYAVKAAELDIAPPQPPVSVGPIVAAAPGPVSPQGQKIVGMNRDMVDAKMSPEPEADPTPTTCSPPAPTKKLDPMRALLKRIPSATGLVGTNARGMLKRRPSFSGLKKKVSGAAATTAAPAAGAAPEAPDAQSPGQSSPDHPESGQNEGSEK